MVTTGPYASHPAAPPHSPATVPLLAIDDTGIVDGSGDLSSRACVLVTLVAWATRMRGNPWALCTR